MPAFVGVNENVPPLPKSLDLIVSPDCEVTLCGTLSSFVQVIFWPTLTETLVGAKAMFCIFTATGPLLDELLLPPLVVAGAGVAGAFVVLLEDEPPPQPAMRTAASASARGSVMIDRRIGAAFMLWSRESYQSRCRADARSLQRHRLQTMAGHSKWAGIKHKKAIVDARRGAHFTKLARAITVAAREGGGDPDTNATLGNAVQKAKDASMPKDNIERAIAKGTGEGADTDAIEAILYEGYGPGGVALLIEALTDNRNRTGSDVRHLLSKHGGSLGEPGSVAYLFDKQGVVTVDASRWSEDDLIVAIDAGAQDIERDEDVFEVLTEPSDLAPVRAALEAAGIELEHAELTQRPKVRVAVEEEQAAKLLRLIDALEDNDDVGAVHANFDVDADVLERLAG